MKTTNRNTLELVAGVTALLLSLSHAIAGDYTVIVSRTTRDDLGWARVVDKLCEKHEADVVLWGNDTSEALPRLRELFPRYACFVARPSEATREFVAAVHRLVRELDADPYADTRWGILTGFDAEGALAVASESEPLTVRRVAAGTDVALEASEEGVWYCELTQYKSVRKTRGGRPVEERCDGDTTAALVATLNDYKPDLFVTSGHATERDWQIGYRYRNGKFISTNGELWGVDITGGRHRVRSPNAKVYLPVGNCLMGHIDGPDAMALAFLESAGVRQMIGYTVPTWYGYAGWGCLDYFLEQPGRYTFAEAFLANHHALVHRLQTYFPELVREQPPPGRTVRPGKTPEESARKAGLGPQDGSGLLHDRDVVAFYGDPAWVARMAGGPRRWEQTLEADGDSYTLEIVPRFGKRTFEPVNRNGSQRGGRPIIEFLPHRVGAVELLEGKELHPVITDDFILVPNPGTSDPERTYRIRFRAKRQGA